MTESVMHDHPQARGSETTLEMSRVLFSLEAKGILGSGSETEL